MSRLSERIENFEKAYNIYEMAVLDYKSDKDNILTHMALIHSFEVVFELSWKVLKDYLSIKGLNVYYPKDVIKEAFAKQTIANGQLWIDMLETRNLTSHEYNMDKVNTSIVKIAGSYFDEIRSFKTLVELLDEK